jgi:hypothetical protein
VSSAAISKNTPKPDVLVVSSQPPRSHIALPENKPGASALMMYIIQFVESRESDRPVQIGTTYEGTSAGDAAGLARVLIRNSELPKAGGFIIYDASGKEVRRQYLDEQCDPPVP